MNSRCVNEALTKHNENLERKIASLEASIPGLIEERVSTFKASLEIDAIEERLGSTTVDPTFSKRVHDMETRVAEHASFAELVLQRINTIDQRSLTSSTSHTKGEVEAICQGFESRMLNFFQRPEHDMDKNREELAAGVKGCSERISSFEGLAKSPSMVQGIGLEDHRKDLEAVETRAGRSVATVADSVHGRMDRLREDFRELHAQVNAMHSSSHSSQAPLGHGHSIASEAPINPKASSKSDYVPPNKDHIPSSGEAIEMGSESQTAKTPTPTANVCTTTSLATPPPTSTTLLSTSSGLQITFDQQATPMLPMTVHSELLHWLFDPSGWLKPLRALTPPSSFDFNQLVPSGIADGMAFHGMQRSRAWCGTPPILGVVNMVGTRNFTCYMGAL